MKTILRILLPIAVLAIGIGVMLVMLKTAPKAKKHEHKKPVPLVEVMDIQTRDYPVTIHSFGEVEASTRTTLVAEVSGRILSVADNFKEGEFVRKGDVLIRIDDRDYRHAVTIARSELAARKVALDQEKAQAQQALIDWNELGDKEPPNDLVLRKPQLASARAAVEGARAKLAQAQTNLDRAVIRAPYDGRILKKQADIGQYVRPGTPVATLFATDYVEIRLPLTDRQLAMVRLPERFRGERPRPGPPVVLRKGDARWRGRITRTSAQVDSKSRQQFVIARVDHPWDKAKDNRTLLKLGLYVEADIQGKTLEDVVVIPRSAVRENDQVFLVVDGKLKRQPIRIAWSSDEQVVVAEGLQPGDQLIISPMPYAADGAPVSIRRRHTER